MVKEMMNDDFGMMNRIHGKKAFNIPAFKLVT